MKPVLASEITPCGLQMPAGVVCIVGNRKISTDILINIKKMIDFLNCSGKDNIKILNIIRYHLEKKQLTEVNCAFVFFLSVA